MLVIAGLPVIDTQPQVLSAAAGDNVTFSVLAHSGAGLSYQWRLNGQAIPGATNASLTLANVTAAQTGLYTVAVANTNGTILSVPAMFSLLNIDLIPGPTARLTVSGPAGSSYRLESMDAFDTAHQWSKLTTITLTNSAFLYLDTNSPSNPKRFYRAIWQP